MGFLQNIIVPRQLRREIFWANLGFVSSKKPKIFYLTSFLGLLPRSLNCPICKNFLFWRRYKKVKDGFGWKCQNGVCAKYKISSRTGIGKRPSSKECSEAIEQCFTGIYKILCGENDLIKTRTLLLIFATISTWFIHSIINFLVKKQFSSCG